MVRSKIKFTLICSYTLYFLLQNSGVFTAKQLIQLKNTSLASVICNNADDIQKITKDVFLIPQMQEWIECNQIEHMDLTEWRNKQTEHTCNDNN